MLRGRKEEEEVVVDRSVAVVASGRRTREREREGRAAGRQGDTTADSRELVEFTLTTALHHPRLIEKDAQSSDRLLSLARRSLSLSLWAMLRGALLLKAVRSAEPSPVLLRIA